jgi:serine/threonine protein kinase
MLINETYFIMRKVIGKGTYGKILLVENKLNSQLYALKSIDKYYLCMTSSTHFIIAEKTILQELNHPFIIKMHSSFKNKEKLFLLFDYFNGGDLFFHIHRSGKIFNECEAKFIAAQLFLALSYLGENRVLYRDLKPENIIFDSEGYIRLIDFGFAKKIKEGESRKSVVGTDEYQAPEVIQGRSYSHCIDWWSFGLIIYEMLIGVSAFYSEDKGEMYNNILREQPKFVNIKGEKVEISTECKNLIEGLLRKNQNERLTSSQILTHPWFKDINFDLLYKKELVAPFIPAVVRLII